MSRILVKNLPKKVSEDMVRDHFKSYGTITDLQLCRREDGAFRRIAFVGFREEGLFDVLQMKVNNTYVGTSRITIHPAITRADTERRQRATDAEKAQQHAQRVARRHDGAVGVIETLKQQGGDALAEFLSISKQKSWEDGVPMASTVADAGNEFDAPVPLGTTTLVQAVATEAHDATGMVADSNGTAEIDESRVKIVGLADTVAEDDLIEAFSPFGEVHSVVVCSDKLTKKPLGIGYITFKLPEAAKQAQKKQDINIHGKIGRISPARMLEQRAPRKEYIVKGRDTHNRLAWNSTFMRAATVASVTSKRLAVGQEAVSANPVLLAVSEAFMAEEACRSLEEHGVIVGKAASDRCRSRTTILVKNLPADVDPTELQKLFEAFGTVKKFVMPYPGYAIVELPDPSDCRRAFGRLAFKRVGPQKSPMFLEYAILKDTINVAEDSQQDTAEDAQVPSVPQSVHIKNVSFATSNQQFVDVCRKLHGFVSANLVLHEKGHKGYGFAEFLTAGNADAACSKLNKIILDGHHWVAALVQSKGQRTDDHTTALSNKIIIKNLAFQSNARELKQLVSQFGRVVSFRAPKKMDGTLRGFAFVEFASERDAEVAYARLSNTHFYGRHLIPEYSVDEGLGAEPEVKAH